MFVSPGLPNCVLMLVSRLVDRKTLLLCPLSYCARSQMILWCAWQFPMKVGNVNFISFITLKSDRNKNITTDRKKAKQVDYVKPVIGHWFPYNKFISGQRNEMEGLFSKKHYKINSILCLFYQAMTSVKAEILRFFLLNQLQLIICINFEKERDVAQR